MKHEEAFLHKVFFYLVYFELIKPSHPRVPTVFKRSYLGVYLVFLLLFCKSSIIKYRLESFDLVFGLYWKINVIHA